MTLPIGRRRFLAGLAATLVAPQVANAQSRARRVALFGLFIPSRADIEAFRRGLRELGIVDGGNILVDIRSADGKPDRLNEAAANLVAGKMDVIVATGTDATRAAHQATKAIPIVTVVGADPVELGFAKSLSRPGGNVTGLTSSATAIVTKQLQLMREAIPRVSRVAVLWRRLNPAHEGSLKALEGQARSMGIGLHPVAALAGELDAAFSAIADARVTALLVLGDAVFMSERERIVRFAAHSALPAVYFRREFAEIGGLISFAADTNDLYRRAASYVDKILKGAKPGELPIEEPSQFELVLNLKTAKALGLTIPQSVLVRADRVIQ